MKSSSSFSIPSNFAWVEKGVYRSAYPDVQHIPWLRHIGIRTVVLLSVEVLPGPVRRQLVQEEGRRHHHHHGVVGGVTAAEPPIHVINVASLESWISDPRSNGNDFSLADVRRALELAVRLEYHPLLLACPTGELQTSVVVGCLRRHQSRGFASILSECESFLSRRCALRHAIMDFIASWNPHSICLHGSSSEPLAPWYVAAMEFQHAQAQPATQHSSAARDSPQEPQYWDSSVEGGTTALPAGRGEEAHSHVSKAAGGSTPSPHTSSSQSTALPPSSRTAGKSGSTAAVAGRTPSATKLEGPHPPAAATQCVIERCVAPFLAYASVRNPPALSAWSSFNPKLSLVEEDDD